MARVSRKNGVSESPPKGQRQTVFRTALYVRLSVEDNGKADADSIENQELLLRNYLAERPYLELKEVYADNGYTGTDFERPAFNRMIEDVRKGRIDCIVVKDFSRLGRNYVETGEYLERIFPFLGIWFGFEVCRLRACYEICTQLYTAEKGRRGHRLLQL